MSCFVCMSCYEVYHHFARKEGWEGDRCPKISCQGLIAEIDEDMIEVIIELNRRGYVTKMCCQGHPRDVTVNTFIEFFDEECFPSQPPKDFTCETNHGHFIFRKKYSKKDSPIELQRQISATMMDLLDWVQELPDNESVLEEKRLVKRLNDN